MNRKKNDLKKAYSPGDLSLRFEGSEWTDLDEKRLVKLFQNTNESIEEISKILGRSVAYIEAKLKNKYGPGVLKRSKK